MKSLPLPELSRVLLSALVFHDFGVAITDDDDDDDDDEDEDDDYDDDDENDDFRILNTVEYNSQSLKFRLSHLTVPE